MLKTKKLLSGRNCCQIQTKYMNKFFTVKELCHTNSGIENIPNSAEKHNIEFLIENVLDPVRLSYGKPIKVNSGFRCKKVNDNVKGKSNSQHLSGQAADLTGGSKDENKKIYKIIKSLGKYDQLINEYDYSWVHVSYVDGHLNRKMEIVVK